jgi:type IV secretion system protein TrbI
MPQQTPGRAVTDLFRRHVDLSPDMVQGAPQHGLQDTSGAERAPDPRATAPEPPPPLTSIRVRGPGARGLNKPAILAVSGAALVLLLVLASNGLGSTRRPDPAQAKPMMSDPARPEMAIGALRDLPRDYREAALQTTSAPRAAIPLLGPPLAGDIAAFAPETPVSDPPLATWEEAPMGPPPPTAPAADAGIDEVEQAARSDLFFAVRDQQPAPSPRTDPVPARDPMRVVAAREAVASATLPRPALFPGAVISASLVTDISSEAPGPVIAQVTQAVHDSAFGRTLIIPQGARLIGDYKSSARYGQRRIAIQWSRIILPDGREIALEAPAADLSGASGLPGEVDNHWGDVFGAAALGTLINIGVATTEDPALTFAGIGAVSRDPVDAAIAEGVQRSASAVSNRVVDRSLTAPPTIRVPAGARVSVIVTRRLEAQM